MTSIIGEEVSHYKILEHLGSGGMGVVYKAEDTHLKRAVALKFLTPELSRDAEAKERFKREAQAASSLDHPNICTVHEIGETPDGQMFIAMALYEGGSLKERITQGALAVHEAIGISTQVAEGLAEAHGHGIIHRDVKPANILVTKNGIAKIVDFGLAKMRGATRLTRSASTMGTIAYMAPEQLQGIDADARADIFSLGVVLYELLSGELPFRGDHEAALIYAILNEEPEDLQKLNPEISPETNQIVRKALEKDLKSRYQSMNDLLLDLRSVQLKVHSVPSLAAKRKHLAIQRARVITIAAILLAFVLVSAIVIFLMRKGSTNVDSRPVTRTLRIPSYRPTYPSISPDGNWLVYVDEDASPVERTDNLYIMNVTEGEPRKITNDTTWGAKRRPSYSPDASKIIYDMRRGKARDIYIVPALGGNPYKLIPNGWCPAWSPDGKYISYHCRPKDVEELWIADANGTPRRKIATTENYWTDCIRSAWSPDSKRLAYLRDFTFPHVYSEIFVHDINTEIEEQITFGKKRLLDLCWASTGNMIFSSYAGESLSLFKMPEAGGEGIQLTAHTGSDRFASTTRDGRRIAFVNESKTQNLWTADLKMKRVQQLTFEDAHIESPSYSPDGTRLLYKKQEAGHTSLVIAESKGSNPTILKNIEHEPMTGTTGWTADGEHVLFSSFIIDTLERNPEKVVYRDAFVKYDLVKRTEDRIESGTLLEVSRDGKFVQVWHRHSADSARIVVSLEATPEKPMKEFPFKGLRSLSFSWDSKNVVLRDSSGIWLVPLESGPPKRLFKTTSRWETFDIMGQVPYDDSFLAVTGNWSSDVTSLGILHMSSGTFEKLVDVPPLSLVRRPVISPDEKLVVFPWSETKNRIMLMEDAQ